MAITNKFNLQLLRNANAAGSKAGAVTAIEGQLAKVPEGTPVLCGYATKDDGHKVTASGVVLGVKAAGQVELFYGKDAYALAQAYVDGLLAKETSKNFSGSTVYAALESLKTSVDAMGGDAGSISTQIKNEIEKLDVTDNAVNNEYVSAVSETDGKISVSRVALPVTGATGSNGTDELVKVTINDSKQVSVASTTKLTDAVSNIEKLMTSATDSVSAQIEAKINALNGGVTAATNYYVSSVTETDGKVTGQTAALPVVSVAGDGNLISANTVSAGVTVSATQTLSDAVTTVNTLNGDANTAGSVKKQIADAVADLNMANYKVKDATAKTDGHVQLALTDGTISITESDIASATALSEVNTAVTANTTAIATLNAGSGTTGSVDQKIATAINNLGMDNYKVKDATTGTTDHVTVTLSDAGVLAVKGSDIASATDLTAAEGRISTLESAIADDGSLGAQVKANKEAIETLNGDATTEGSVKKAAADAVAEVLDGAPTAFDTLKEVAEWISTASATTAANIATDVTTLKTTVGGNTSGLVKDVADLQAALGADGSVATQIATAISDLDVTDTAEANKYVSAVSETDGKISVTRVALPVTSVVNATDDAHVTVSTDTNGKVTVTSKDVASTTGLTAEETARKAQDDVIEAAIGLAADGKHVTTTGNYTSGASTIAGEIAALDTQVKTNADDIAKAITGVTGTNGVTATTADNAVTVSAKLADDKQATTTYTTSGTLDKMEDHNVIEIVDGGLYVTSIIDCGTY